MMKRPSRQFAIINGLSAGIYMFICIFVFNSDPVDQGDASDASHASSFALSNVVHKLRPLPVPSIAPASPVTPEPKHPARRMKNQVDTFAT